MAELNVYMKPNLTWGWRLRDDKQRIIAVDGTSGYPDADEAFELANRIVDGGRQGPASRPSPDWWPRQSGHPFTRSLS